MNITNTQHSHDDDDERELRRQLGPLRDLHRQHTEGAVVNMSVRVHEALQQPRHNRFRSIKVSAAVGFATAIVIVVVLNFNTSESVDERDITLSGTTVTTDTVKQDVLFQSIPGSRASTEPSIVVATQRDDAQTEQRLTEQHHRVTQTRATHSTRANSPTMRPHDMTDTEVVLLRDSEMLRAVNLANEDAIVDRILDLDADDDFAVLDLTSADVDAVLP